MRNYKFTFEVDDETFKNIAGIELAIKHRNSDKVSKVAISKRSMKYKANFEFLLHREKLSTEA